MLKEQRSDSSPHQRKSTAQAIFAIVCKRRRRLLYPESSGTGTSPDVDGIRLWGQEAFATHIRHVLAGLAKGLSCLHICAQVAALQMGDVGINFIDVRRNALASNRASCFSNQFTWLIITLSPHMTQCPDQLIGMGGIPPFTRCGIVAPAGAPGTLNRAASKMGLSLHTDCSTCVLSTRRFG